MKKQVEFGKLIKRIVFILVICICLMAVTLYGEYRFFMHKYNYSLGNIISNIQEKNPDVTDEEIFEIIKENRNSENFADRYDIDDNNDILLKNVNMGAKLFLAVEMVIFIGALGIIILLCVLYDLKRRKQIKEIAGYIEQINNKNYEIDIDDMSEDELSYLKSEIYKTTVMLKEVAENSKKDKKDLKVSLEDISHQIKTPLTSILVILDNLIEEPDMDNKVRTDFVMDIKREINNINFLVQTLLKLSKFDSNTMSFNRKENSISDIVDESIKNVETLCDLKNITINVKEANILGEKTSSKEQNGFLINCDLKWQIEAITNILKNCIEHSGLDSAIDIIIGGNNVYKEISIKDHAGGISDKDMPHLFERFYKGTHSKSDSYGIGLSLSKTIVESDNGDIFVENVGDGAEFTVKYYII